MRDAARRGGACGSPSMPEVVELSWLNRTTSMTSPTAVATHLFVLAIVVASGLMLGHVRFFGVRLGVAGVPFSGMFFGHLGWSLPSELLEFTGDFGLILFVFAIGLAINPGFFNALRAHLLTLKLMAATIVLLGVMLTVAVNRFAGIEIPIATGIFRGAMTSTPSLAAAVQTLRDHSASINEIAKLPGLDYAISYPLGVVGIIGSMLVMKIFFRFDPVREATEIHDSLQSQPPELERRNLRVTNPNLQGPDVPKELERSELESPFNGIAGAGLFGSIPISLSGTAAPVKLGLAGGQLWVAMVLGSIGRFFYLSRPASHRMREIGVAIFLATVGLLGGDRFIASLVQGDGIPWLLTRVVITVVPLLIVAAIGRYLRKLDSPTSVGVVAGSMDDPPTWSFANEQTESALPAISYASVVPLTMILRLLAAPIVILSGC